MTAASSRETPAPPLCARGKPAHETFWGHGQHICRDCTEPCAAAPREASPPASSPSELDALPEGFDLNDIVEPLDPRVKGYYDAVVVPLLGELSRLREELEKMTRTINPARVETLANRLEKLADRNARDFGDLRVDACWLRQLPKLLASPSSLTDTDG
jgi:hypothetical protein